MCHQICVTIVPMATEFQYRIFLMEKMIAKIGAMKVTVCTVYIIYFVRFCGGTYSDPRKINECEQRNDLCDESATCTNIEDGSYFCTCPENMWGDGTYCNWARTETTTLAAQTSTQSTGTTSKTTFSTPKPINLTSSAPSIFVKIYLYCNYHRSTTFLM